MGVMCLLAEERQGLQPALGIRRQTRAGFSLTASEGTNLAETLILDFQPPELRENKFPLL